MALCRPTWVATKNSGVYYTPNIDASPQPVWAADNDGLAATDCLQFAWDPFAPATRQYVLLSASRTLYRRENGGDWESILDTAAARTLTGAASGTLQRIWCDPTVEGRIWVTFFTPIWALYSDDYGDTWTAPTIVYTSGINLPVATYSVRAVGDLVWVLYAKESGWNIAISANKGASWTSHGTAVSPSYLALNAASLDRVYFDIDSPDGFHTLQSMDAAGTTTSHQTGLTVSEDNMWFDPADADHMRLVRNSRLYVTTDGWANINSPSAISPDPSSIAPSAGSDADEMVVGLTLDLVAPGEQYHAIGLLSGEDDVTATGVAGSLCDTSPYTDSIPATCGGVCLCGILVVEEEPQAGPPPNGTIITPPGGSPITLHGPGQVQAVSLPGYTSAERSVPIPGDRSAFDSLNYPAEHAADLHEGTPTAHNPADAEAGEAPVWDGAKWVATDIATQAELDTHEGTPDAHHDPVTLGAGNDPEMLTLDDQEIEGHLKDHGHTAAAGDGGQIELAAQKSTGATAKQVATADGADGVSWQTPQAVGEYRQFVYAPDGLGSFSFVVDGEGMPVFALLALE